MADVVGATVSFPGTTDSTAAMVALANAVAGLDQRVSGLNAKTAENTAVTRTSAGATNEAASAQQTAATQAIAFGQRIAGVANAVQNLTSRMGSHNTTAGLVGSLVQTTTQFASMGAALGPQGAVIGGIAGLVVAITELADAQTNAAERTRALQEANVQLGHQVQETTRSIAAELVADQNLYREHADSVASFWNTVTGNTARALQQLRADRAAIERDQRRLAESAATAADPTGLAGLGAGHTVAFGSITGLPSQDDVTALTGLGGPRGRHGGSGPTRDQRADQQTAQVRQLIDALSRSEEDASQFADQLASLEQQFSTVWGAAYDGASNYDEEQGRLIDAVRSLQSEEQRAHEAREAAAQSEIDHAHELAEVKHQAAEQDQRDSAKLAARRAAEDAQVAKTLALHRQAVQQAQQIQQQHTQQAQEATSAVIGNLTNVFTLMAEGQASAAQGAELLLAGFLQYISQRATIEALAQVAQGIGSYPDFGGMALHFAAAAAWGAVAVATGVGGAALASDAQSKGAAAQSQAQQQPASPQHSSGDDKKGGDTFIVNWNGPVVTASTEAQLGRVVNRISDRARQRYGAGG